VKNKLFTLLSLACAALSVICALLPGAYIMRWGTPDPGEILTTAYAYFSPMPLGYANFFPFAAAVLAVLCVVLLSCQIVSAKPAKASLICTVVGLLCAVLALVMSYGTTAVGVVIAALFALSLTFQLVRRYKGGTQRA